MKQEDLIQNILGYNNPTLIKYHNQQAPIKVEHLQCAIEEGINYLIKAIFENGKFQYRINIDSNVNVKPKYNILRHAGAMYSMNTYAQTIRYNNQAITKELESAILNSTLYLQREAMAVLPEEQPMLGIWENYETSGKKNANTIKLGGTGLGLIALTGTKKLFPNTVNMKDLKLLGESILFMQKADGSFYSKYKPNKGGLREDWESLFYPGEAALGLVMLYEQDPEIKWLNAALQALGYLAKRRKERLDVECDHWALLATAKLLKHYHKIPTPLISKQSLIEHGMQICYSILRDGEQSITDYRLPFFGSFCPMGRTTPTATRLEGLIAALEFIPNEAKQLKKHMVAAIDLSINFLLQAQIKDAPYEGAMPRSALQIENEGSNRSAMKFNQRAGEIRIDYVQHCISALMQYQALLVNEKTKVKAEANC